VLKSGCQDKNSKSSLKELKSHVDVVIVYLPKEHVLVVGPSVVRLVCSPLFTIVIALVVHTLRSLSCAKFTYSIKHPRLI